MDGTKYRPVRRRNRPIAPDGRRGQPPDAPTAFSRDAVGIVIFEKVSPCCAPRPHCRSVAAKSAGARLDRGGAGSKRHGFSFHGDAPHAPCRHASGRVLGERYARRGGEPADFAAAGGGHAVAVGPEGRSRAGRRRASALCRRTTPPAAGFHHHTDAGAARPHAQLHCHRRLDPNIRRQGRAAGRHRLYVLPARRRRSHQQAGDVSVQWRPRRVPAWLQFGDAGPWRISITGEGAVSSATPDLLPNAETWLDFTDLVFIDPVGTGYSRFVASGEDVRKRFFSVDGDVNSIALVIRRWVEKYDRLLSPKFVAGESYGGIRGPKIVRNLQTQQGVGVRGLILVSPLLDFRDFSGSSLLQYMYSLPSMTAVAREAKGETKGRVTRADLADVERYAQGEFIVDLLKGQADKEATARLTDKVAALTGIDQAVSRRLAGRFEVGEFRREFDRRNGRVTGRYDASVSGFDPYPDSNYAHFGDPSGDPLMAPLTSAAVDLATRKLNWRPDGSYQLLSDSVNKSWDFGRGPAESGSQVRQGLPLDPKMKLP